MGAQRYASCFRPGQARTACHYTSLGQMGFHSQISHGPDYNVPSDYDILSENFGIWEKAVHETLPGSMYMPVQQYIQTGTLGLIERG